MSTFRHAVLATLLLLPATAVPAIPAPASPGAESDLAVRLSRAAPGLDRAVLARALSTMDCAVASHATPAPARLAVIDYTLPSTEVRMWVFDLQRARLLAAEHVAHGRGSGDNLATAFSNVEGSHQSSLGLFRMAETYVGGNGYSLRMDGLERGINDRARERLVVMHGADYVDPVRARRQGRLGRSFGCPALRPAVARRVIDQLKGGQLLFAHADDPAWRRASPWRACTARSGAAGVR